MTSISIFTYIDRYTPYLDIWLRYYKKIVPDIHVYILHRSTSTFDLQTYISNQQHDHIYERQIDTTNGLYVVDTHIFSDMHAELLSKYDVVLYADIDEIIMVGGMTRMPSIMTRLEKKFGIKPNNSLNPDIPSRTYWVISGEGCFVAASVSFPNTGFVQRKSVAWHKSF